MGFIKYITGLFSPGRSENLIDDDPDFRRLLKFDNTKGKINKVSPPEPEERE